MSEQKSGFVAIIGRPNVGKSTLLNAVLGQKISITSDKPQTTRERIRGIYTDERGQIVFVDTPGINRPKSKLGGFMSREVDRGRSECDLILWLVEPDTVPGPGDRRIAQDLQKSQVPVFLVINKTDKIKREEVLPVIDVYKDMVDFAEIFPVSARKAEGVDALLDEVYSYLPYGPYFYDEEEVTDLPVRALVAEIIREKALHLLNEELPHGIAVMTDAMKLNDRGNLYHIDATIVCEKPSHKGMIIGKQGGMLKKLGSLARRDIEEMVGKKVNLKIWVRVKERWRDDERLIKNFGYKDAE